MSKFTHEALLGRRKLGEYGNVGTIVKVDPLGLGWVTIDFGWYEVHAWEWSYSDAPMESEAARG